MKQLLPLYTLAYGIHVIGEYPARGKNPYVRLRIRPHRFFPDAPVTANGILVRKNRVILSIKLGRALKRHEYAHHRDEDKSNDSPSNIELQSANIHNQHHKTGTNHRTGSKAKISMSLKRAFSEGRRSPTVIPNQAGSSNYNAKLTRENIYEIRTMPGTQQSFAEKFGVSRSNIGMIKRGVTWK